MRLFKYEHSILNPAVSNAACICDSNTLWYDFRKEFSPQERRRFKQNRDIRLDDRTFEKFIRRFRQNANLFAKLPNMHMTPEGAVEFNSSTIPALEAMLKESIDTPERMHAFDDAAREITDAARKNQLQLTPEQEARKAEIHTILERTGGKKLGRKISRTDLDYLASGIVCAETAGPVALYTNDAKLLEMAPHIQERVEEGAFPISSPVSFYSTIGLGKREFALELSVTQKKEGKKGIVLVYFTPEAAEAFRGFKMEDFSCWMKENLPHLGYAVEVEKPGMVRMAKHPEKYAMVGKVAVFNSGTDPLGVDFAACITDDEKKVIRCQGYLANPKDNKPLAWYREDPDFGEIGRITFGIMEAFLSGATNIKPILEVCRKYRRTG